MWLLRPLLMRWLWRRLTGRGRGGPEARGGRRSRGTAPARRSRAPASGGRRGGGRFGFLGPLPSYSTRTRRGSRVTVTGCCLPLSLGALAVPALVLRAALRR
jgi:hypothetical protein